MLMFQSLLYWISHCGRVSIGPQELNSFVFQSLLYWISHCGIFLVTQLLRLFGVSILVVLD